MITAQRSKILVVDDNPRNIALIEGYIKPHFDVIKAESGEECLELLKKEDVDLIILDVALPGINGYEVCKRIKGNKTTKNIPVIIIPALPTGQEQIRSFQVGAEDFIDRPFSMNAIVARVKALLKIKDLYTDLEKANENLSTIIAYTSRMLKDFDSSAFDEKEFYKSLLKMLLREKPYEKEKPTHVFLGWKNIDDIEGRIFSHNAAPVECTVPEYFYNKKNHAKNNDSNGVIYSNHTDKESILEYQECFHSDIRNNVGKIINFAAYISKHVAIITFNYGRAVSLSDALMLRGLTIHCPFFSSISRRARESDDTVLYTINTLSKAAEAAGEDTGNHIFRVNKYATVIAKQLGLSDVFVKDIGIAAQTHDVGKIFLPLEILKKQGQFLTEEFEVVKRHPVYGAKILGGHPRLKIAQNIALTHHERWNGSGYPYGLKGEIIPIEGRILNIADQYDALRTARSYKPAYSHVDACRIFTEGDGRTMPYHFDPKVLQAFKDVSAHLSDIYTESGE